MEHIIKRIIELEDITDGESWRRESNGLAAELTTLKLNDAATIAATMAPYIPDMRNKAPLLDLFCDGLSTYVLDGSYGVLDALTAYHMIVNQYHSDTRRRNFGNDLFVRRNLIDNYSITAFREYYQQLHDDEIKFAEYMREAIKILYGEALADVYALSNSLGHLHDNGVRALDYVSIVIASEARKKVCQRSVPNANHFRSKTNIAIMRFASLVDNGALIEDYNRWFMKYE